MVLQDSSAEPVALALDANKIAFGILLSALPNATLHDEPGLLWFETGIAEDGFNGVLQIRLSPDDLPAAIEKVLAHFQSRNLPFHWHIGPCSQPADFGDTLVADGISHDEDEPGMAADLLSVAEEFASAPRLAIIDVLTESQLFQWSQTTHSGAPRQKVNHVFTAYSGLPHGGDNPLRLYLGTVDGEPVATVKLFLEAGVAYIGRVVTIPGFRRQGIGRAMTMYAMHAARHAGYRIAVLTASPMGINIYRRLGFKEFCVVSTYVWNPPGSQEH